METHEIYCKRCGKRIEHEMFYCRLNLITHGTFQLKRSYDLCSKCSDEIEKSILDRSIKIEEDPEEAKDILDLI